MPCPHKERIIAGSGRQGPIQGLLLPAGRLFLLSGEVGECLGISLPPHLGFSRTILLGKGGGVLVYFFSPRRQLFEGLSGKALSRDRGGSRVSAIIAARHEIWFAKYLKKVGAGFVFPLSLVNGN